jgi:hypothetical protein
VDLINICLDESDLDFNITIEAVDLSKPVRLAWEAFFKYIDPITGLTYYGQQGSIVRINGMNVIETRDLVNTNSMAEDNQCERCKHPAPLGSPHRLLGSSRDEGGPGGDEKAKRLPLKFPFVLFDGDGAGWWYQGGNGTDDVCAGQSISNLPNAITSPRYSIMSGDRTTLIHEGTICGGFSTEACEELLPYDGQFVFRVSGHSQDPNKVSWEFCGATGILGEEVQFEMVKGNCVVVDKRAAEDYCQGIKSISVWSGSLLLLGVSSDSFSSSSSSNSMKESRVLEETLSELLFHSEVYIDAMVGGETGLKVAFSSKIIMEELGYIGVYSDEAELAEEFIEATVIDAISAGVMLASLQNLLSRDPVLSAGAIGLTESVSLLEFQMTSLSFQTKMSLTNENSNAPDSQEAGEEGDSKVLEEKKSNPWTRLLLNGSVSGAIIGFTFIGVMLFLLLKPNSPSLPSRFDPESSHSLLA